MAIKCEECMQDAPYKWCCKTVCMEIEVCKSCEAKCKEVVNECPKERTEDGRIS